MKLITKSSLTFISASVLFFLVGSIIMYFSVRTIFSSNLNDILLKNDNCKDNNNNEDDYNKHNSNKLMEYKNQIVNNMNLN